MDEHGRVFVADGAGGLASVIVYGSDGSFVREDQLQLYLTPRALATDGKVVYVAGQALFWTDPPPDSRPVLAAYDPSTGQTEVLLSQTSEWYGEPPVYRNSFVDLIPKVDAHGNLYIGFVEGYEIWKITGPQEYEVVARGCVPERVLEVYEAEGDGAGRLQGGGVPSIPGLNLRLPRLSYRLLADFNVLPDGGVITRSVIYVDETGRRSMEMFSAEGELIRAWSLGPGQLLTGWGVMDGSNPARHLSWNMNEGTAMLVEFPIGEVEFDSTAGTETSGEQGEFGTDQREMGMNWVLALAGAGVLLAAGLAWKFVVRRGI